MYIISPSISSVRIIYVLTYYFLPLSYQILAFIILFNHSNYQFIPSIYLFYFIIIFIIINIHWLELSSDLTIPIPILSFNFTYYQSSPNSIESIIQIFLSFHCS